MQAARIALLVAGLTVIGYGAPDAPARPPEPAGRSAAAGAPPEEGDSRTITSASRRFSASGPDTRVLVPLLNWADDICARLERMFGEPLPALSPAPIRFECVDDPDLTHAVVRRRLAVNEWGVNPVLVVVNLDRADPAEVLTAMASLMLSCYAGARQSPEERQNRPAVAPDWLAAGASRLAYPRSRADDFRSGLESWRKGDEVSFRRILALDVLPSGAGEEQAMCTLLVCWLRSRPDFRRVSSALFETCARGEKMDEERLVRLLGPGLATRELRQSWDLWLAAQQQIEMPWNLTATEAVERLRRALEMPTALVPVELPPGLPDTLTPPLLARHREEPWAGRVAAAIESAVWTVPLGPHPDLAAAADLYRQALEQIRRPAPSIPWRWFTWGWRPHEIETRLEAADRRVADFLVLAEARREAALALAAERGNRPADPDAEADQEAQRMIFRDAVHPPK